jgi:hypothetical protein
MRGTRVEEQRIARSQRAGLVGVTIESPVARAKVYIIAQDDLILTRGP